ncbi:MAG: TrgA family protein, partial [Pseudomonadota bacterium]
MPTPAKLVSAILFAALAWWVGETIVREVLPEGVRVGRFREFLALGGLIVGWKYIGRIVSGPTNKGTSITVAITAGIGGAAILLVLGLLLEGFRKMITESLDLRYAEVGEAASAWMEFLWRDAQTIAHPVVLGTLFGGAVAVGLIGG